MDNGKKTITIKQPSLIQSSNVEIQSSCSNCFLPAITEITKKLDIYFYDKNLSFSICVLS